MKFTCARCGKKADRPAGHINRQRAGGYKLYCGRKCSGLGRRKNKSKAQKIEEKRIYDAAYRKRNLKRITERKKAYHAANYDPEKQRAYNKNNMQRHVEYCRRPEYKAYKHRYDVDQYAQQFGPFAEAHKLEMSLRREIKDRITNYESRQEQGTFGKSQARKRADEGEAQRRRSREGRFSGRRRDPSAFGQ